MDFRDDTPEDDRKEVRDKLESDRRHELDAAIIRIMKGRQQMDHSELLAELDNLLRHRFIPTMDMIKKSLESLIAREYLARAEENRLVASFLCKDGRKMAVLFNLFEIFSNDRTTRFLETNFFSYQRKGNRRKKFR